MKMKVKLHGTLIQRFPGYQHSEGIEVEIPDDATIKDLLALLGISESQRAVVAMGGRIRKPDDKILGGAYVHVFNAIYGG
jgi:sulfur carrier protein ThiS